MTGLDGYTLDRVLARGGMAEVWLAHKNGPGGFSKPVVLKRVLPHLAADADFMAMFLKEARVAALFSHVNLVRIFELGESDDGFFIAMEYVRGCTLRALQRACFDQQVGLPLDVLARIITDACEGLQYAHELTDLKGRPLHLVHLDVSPENLLISSEGITKVSDFGVARAREHSHSLPLQSLYGKAVYMAPEQASGRELDRRADVYALGAITFELVSGHVPIEIDSSKPREPQLQRARIDWSAVRAVLPALEPVLLRALAISADDRQPTSRALAVELVAVLGPPASPEGVAACMAELIGVPADTLLDPPEVTQTPSVTPTSPSISRETTPLRVAARRPEFVKPRARGGVAAIVALVALVLVLGAARLWWLTPSVGTLTFEGADRAIVLVDGQPVDRSAPLRLSVGRHRVEVVGAGDGHSTGRWLEVLPGPNRPVALVDP